VAPCLGCYEIAEVSKSGLGAKKPQIWGHCQSRLGIHFDRAPSRTPQILRPILNFGLKLMTLTFYTEPHFARSRYEGLDFDLSHQRICQANRDIHFDQPFVLDDLFLTVTAFLLSITIRRRQRGSQKSKGFCCQWLSISHVCSPPMLPNMFEK